MHNSKLEVEIKIIAVKKNRKVNITRESKYERQKREENKKYG